MIPTLETERLRLRAFCEADLDAYAEMCADPEVMQYLGTGKTFTRGESWRSIAGFLGHWQLRGYGMWALEEKATGTLVGRAGFLHPPDWPDFEIGWTLGRPYWGRGFALEASRRALDHAWRELRRERVVSLIRPANAPSIRVAEKLGARRVGPIDMLGSVADLYEHARP